MSTDQEQTSVFFLVVLIKYNDIPKDQHWTFLEPWGMVDATVRLCSV